MLSGVGPYSISCIFILDLTDKYNILLCILFAGEPSTRIL